MKMFMASLATETNTFSPLPTGNISYEEAMHTRNASKEGAILLAAPMVEWRISAEARGWEVIESLATMAQPGGLTVRSTYEGYRDEILADVAEHKPEVVILSLHGAMVADGYDDCEGDLLSRIRNILGDSAIIGVEIDLHALLTPLMMSSADIIVPYKEYPHTDIVERGNELFKLVADTVDGKIKPVMRDYDCRMITMYHPSREPIRSFVDEMMAREGKDGVLHVGFVHSFPWGDTPDVGSRILAITDGDAGKAAAIAEEFGQKLWAIRDQMIPDWPDIPGALDIVEAATSQPIVLADFADNCGAGAPSDSTFVLRQILDRNMKDIAIGMIWDPVLVRICCEAGVGAEVQARIGGKIGAVSGDPVDATVIVRAIKHNMHMFLGDTKSPMGTGVWLEADGVHIVINDIRTQCLSPNGFTDLGIDLSKMKGVVVKSMQHFYAAFAPVAAEVHYINGPGAVTPDYAAIPYRKRDLNYWPRVENPW